jgi:hypothetical protein
MSSLKFFFKIFLFTFIIAGIIAIIFFSSNLRETVFGFAEKQSKNVLGASTKRAQEVTSQIGSDIGAGFTVAENQVLNMKVSDALHLLNRFQRIPQDFQSMQKYVQEQANNVLKLKK